VDEFKPLRYFSFFITFIEPQGASRGQAPAWWCFKEAAEVHANLLGMRKLALFYDKGRGVQRDPAKVVAEG